MMKRLLFTVLIAFTGVIGTANADLFSVRQKLVTATGDGEVEVTTYLAENEQDREKITAIINEELKGDRKANPELITGFEWVTIESPKSVSAQSEQSVRETIEKIAEKREVHTRTLDADAAKTIQKSFPTWGERVYKISLVTSRTLFNGGVTAYSLMVSQHIPFELAAASGALIGGGIVGVMSGTAQYFNAALGTYLTKSVAKKWIKPGLTQKIAMKVEPFIRWYLLELGFVAIAKSAMNALGFNSSESTGEVVTTTLVAALGAFVAQGFWDVAVSKVTKEKIAEALSASLKKKVQLRADLIALGISALSVTGMVSKLQHLPIANVIFGGMAVTGFAYFVKVNYKEWVCKRNLKKALKESPAESGAENLSN